MQAWREIRDEVSGMLKGRELSYADALRGYYRAHPRKESEKRASKKAQPIDFSYKKVKASEEFDYKNCVERKYWKDPPKSEADLEKDVIPENRVGAAIVFLEKLRKFLASQECIDDEQWLVENFSKDEMSRIRMDIFEAAKKDVENKKWKSEKDENGKDEFDY